MACCSPLCSYVRVLWITRVLVVCVDASVTPRVRACVGVWGGGGSTVLRGARAHEGMKVQVALVPGVLRRHGGQTGRRCREGKRGGGGGLPKGAEITLPPDPQRTEKSHPSAPPPPPPAQPFRTETDPPVCEAPCSPRPPPVAQRCGPAARLPPTGGGGGGAEAPACCERVCARASVCPPGPVCAPSSGRVLQPKCMPRQVRAPHPVYNARGGRGLQHIRTGPERFNRRKARARQVLWGHTGAHT